jgi:2-methylisocitrate lyase-like PEP mutase family enzyme
VEGLDGAIERASNYVDAGADAIFVEALTSDEEFRIVGRELGGVPLVANMVEGGRSPLLDASVLGAMGYRLVIHANLALRLGAAAILEGLSTLRATGSSRGLLERIMSWDDRQRLVGLGEFEAMEQRVIDRTARTGADDDV